MHCPRLDHFAKVVPKEILNTHAVMNCCVMIDAPTFNSYDEMMQSQWLADVKNQFTKNIFPKECVRCREKEEIGITSDRMFWLESHKELQSKKSDYLTISVKLDNICNTACQFCNSKTSSTIAHLSKSKIKIYEVGNFLDTLPTDRITQVDFEGGEPSNSKNVKLFLENLPSNVDTVKIFSNGRSFMPELIPLAQKGITVQISLSLDGFEKIQEYIRWPTKWQEYKKTIVAYKNFVKEYPKQVSIHFFTTVCAFNVNDLENIIKFAQDCDITISFSQLSKPRELAISNLNRFTTAAKEKYINSPNEYLKKLSRGIATKSNNEKQLDDFIRSQDQLRKIRIEDYIKINKTYY